jgi:hypothetical protein
MSLLVEKRPVMGGAASRTLKHHRDAAPEKEYLARDSTRCPYSRGGVAARETSSGSELPHSTKC